MPRIIPEMEILELLVEVKKAKAQGLLFFIKKDARVADIMRDIWRNQEAGSE